MGAGGSLTPAEGGGLEQRRRIEDELLRAEQLTVQLRVLYEQATDGIVLLDSSWCVIDLNPAAQRLLGCEASSVVGASVWDEFSELLEDPFGALLREAMASQEPAESEARWGRTRFWLEARVLPANDGLAIYLRDVTERHESEQERIALVDRLTAIVGVVQQMTGSARRDGVVTALVPDLVADVFRSNGAVLFRREQDQLVPIAACGIADETMPLPIATSLAGLAWAQGRAMSSADVFRDPRIGNDVPLITGMRSALVAPVPTDGHDDLVLAAIDDRTGWFEPADEPSMELLSGVLGSLVRRLVAEEAALEAAERFEMLSHATSDALYDWDLVTRSVWWSEGMTTLFGWDLATLDDLGVHAWTEIVHPEDYERAVGELRSFLTDPRREIWETQYRLRRRDGTYAWVLDRSFALRRADGRALRLIGGISDITDRLESEARSRQSQRLEAVGQLTGGVAHDFNNLLTVILGASDQLTSEITSPDGISASGDLLGLVEMTRDAALRGAELSHRLLAFARRQPLDPRPVDVHRLLAHLSTLLRRTLPEDIHLEFVRGAGLWPAQVDPGQFESALLNLCLNARDAMPDGGQLTVETANAHIDDAYAGDDPDIRPGQYVLVAVTDSGAGMTAAVRDRAFDPFFTTKPTGAGTGLGLSMVHGFIKQSGGHVRIYSEPGDGTTIRMYLPRARAEVAEPDTIGEVRSDHRGWERILVVEDDGIIRRLASNHLRDLGYEVHVAASGDEALERWDSFGRIDLLFTDVVMPGRHSGVRLAEAARERQPGLLVLFTSGYTENAIVHHGQLDPGVQLLPKPYRLADLTARIRRLLDADGSE